MDKKKQNKKEKGEQKFSSLSGNAMFDIFESMIDSVAITDVMGNVIQCNTAFVKMHGFKESKEIIGINIAQIVAEREISKVMNEFKNSFETGIAMNFEFVAKGKNNREFPVMINATALKDENDKTVGTIGVIRDITERKKTEEEIIKTKAALEQKVEEEKQSRRAVLSIMEDMEEAKKETDLAYNYTSNIIKSMADILIVTGPEGKIKTVNQAACNLLEYSEEELIGRPVATIFAEEEEEEEEEFGGAKLKELIEKGFIQNYDITYRAKTGEKIPMNFAGSVMKDEKGSLIGIVAVARDMREIKALIDNLQASNKSLLQRSYELDSLVELSKVMGNIVDYEELFTHILNTLYRLIKYDLAGAIFYTERTKEIIVKLTSPVEKKTCDRIQDYLINSFKEISGEELTPEELKVKFQWVEGCQPQKLKEEIKIKSFFNVPLIVEGKIQGMFNISSFSENYFTQEHIRLIFTIVNQTAISIQRLQLLMKVEKSRLQSILDSMADGVVLLDLNQKITLINPAGEKMLEVLTEEKEVLTRLGHLIIKNIFKEISTASAHLVRHEVISERSPKQLFDMIVCEVKGWGEEPNSIMITLRDVTEARKTQEYFFQTSKLVSIGELAAGVAHELNNPLTSMLGYAQLVIENNVSPEINEKLKLISTEAQRAAKVVQNLLAFAHKHKVEKEEVDIIDALKKTIELKAYELNVNNIKLTTEFAPNPCYILGDYQLIQQVFLNIISNAQQAMVDANNGGELILKTEVERDKVKIFFTDSGLGVPKENLENIFDPFFTTKVVGKGTGLGLSIAHGIIQDHEGRIDVESEVGKGTTFIVELPLLKERGVKKEETPMKRHIDMEGKRVLVIDDEEAIGNLLKIILEKEKCIVDITNNGKLGLEKINNDIEYDLILCDIKMPVISGEEFYNIISKGKPQLAKKIVFVTGDTIGHSSLSFLEKTGVSYLRKPFLPNEIREWVKDFFIKERGKHAEG